MKRHVALAAVTLALALSACSSSDDDPASLPPDDASGPTAPGIAEGEPDPSTPGPDGGTSMPAPDSDEPPLSSEPGGDTRAVAGYWDGTPPDGDGERYFVITENGQWTEYFLTYEGDVPGNCYWPARTLTLTPEDPATDAYTLADGRSLTLVADEARERLTVGFVDENRTETWPAVVGRVVEDLPLCRTL